MSTKQAERRTERREPVNQFDRLPPQANDAEICVLASMMLEKEMRDTVIMLVDRDDFYSADHQIIFDVIVDLADENSEVDAVIVANELKKRQLLSEVGGIEYLKTILGAVPSAAHGAHYAKIVREKSNLRKLIQVGNDIIRSAYSPHDDVEKIMDAAEKSVLSITGERTSIEPEQIGEALMKAYEAMEAKSTRGIPTGFFELDDLLNGLQNGEMIVIAARPSMGKSALAMNIIENVVLKHGVAALLFSLEMSKQSLMQRLLCAHAGVDAGKARRHALSREDFSDLADALKELSKAPIFVDESSSLTIRQLRAKSRRYAVQNKVKLIVIDYLQLMDNPGPESRQQQITEISRGIKSIARELNVPVIALSQLNRQSEGREGHRPRMSDLRESGCLAGDTLITLSDSGERMSIEKLVGKSGFGVWAVDANGVRSATCTRVFATGKKPTLAMTTNTGKRIVATANHKFLTRLGWRRLDELKPGDRIACHAEMHSPSRVSQMPENEMFLLGHMIGNGSILKSHAAQYTTRHRDIAEAFKKTAKSFFGREVDPHIKYDNPRSQSGWYQVFLKSLRRHTHGVKSIVSEWADRHGIFNKRSCERILPDSVFKMSQGRIAKLMTALWETDGTIAISKHKQMPACAYSTTSEVLAQQIQYLISRMGVIAGISVVKQGIYKPAHQINIRGGREGISAFLSQMKFVGREHLSRQAEIEHRISGMRGRSTTTLTSDAGIAYETIRGISSAGEKECYDMTVPGPENMEAAMFVAHNSIEQDSDVVMLLHREDYYKRNNPDFQPDNIAEVIVAKQRNGPIGSVKLTFDDRTTSFRNLSGVPDPNLPM